VFVSLGHEWSENRLSPNVSIPLIPPIPPPY
jgi:hypothetical protein